MLNENRFSVLKTIISSTSSANDIEFIFCFILSSENCITMRQTSAFVSRAQFIAVYSHAQEMDFLWEMFLG